MIPHCALCGRDCTDDDYCHGCTRYVCAAHPGPPLGSHAPEAHLGHDDPADGDEDLGGDR